MKVLVVDFIYNVKQHLKMNCDYINALSRICEVIVYAKEGFYESGMLAANVEVITYKDRGAQGNGLKRIKDSLYVMRGAGKLDKKIKFDAIFALTYDLRATALGMHFFKRRQTLYLMNHYNIDALERFSNFIFYFFYKNRVNQLVLEKYFKDHLVKRYNVKDELVYYVPHKAHFLENRKVVKAGKYDCVGISNSNDEQLISKIVQLEMTKKVFEGRRVILRSRNQEFDDGNLKVINHYLSADEYADYMNCASQIFIPFPDSFKYRLSGTLYEALAAKKKVITTDIPLARDFQERYEGCCSIINSAEQFIRSIKDEQEHGISGEAYEKFMVEHSEDEIIQTFRKILNITEK